MAENPFDRLASFYDWEHADFLDDLPFYLGLAERVGGPILEAGCGSGRLAIPLAEAGYRVVGIDSSPEMLALAEARRAAGGLPPERLHLRQVDLSTARLDQRFRLAIVALDTFGLLRSLPDQQRTLATLRGHLDPAGLLVLDLANGNLRGGEPSEETVLHLRRCHVTSGEEIVKWVHRRTDHAEQLDHLLQVYDVSGVDGVVRRTSVDLTLRYFTRFELEHLLERAGFVLETLFGDYDLTPFRPQSERLIAVSHASQPVPPDADKSSLYTSNR